MSDSGWIALTDCCSLTDQLTLLRVINLHGRGWEERSVAGEGTEPGDGQEEGVILPWALKLS